MGIEVRFARGDDSEEHRLADRRAHPGNLRRDHRQPSLQRSRFRGDRRDRPQTRGRRDCRQHVRSRRLPLPTDPLGGQRRYPLGHQVDRRPRHEHGRRHRRRRQLRLGQRPLPPPQRTGRGVSRIQLLAEVRRPGLRRTGSLQGAARHGGLSEPLQLLPAAAGARNALAPRTAFVGQRPRNGRMARTTPEGRKRKLPRSEEQPLPHPRPASTSPTDSAPSSRSGSRVPSSRRPPC